MLAFTSSLVAVVLWQGAAAPRAARLVSDTLLPRRDSNAVARRDTLPIARIALDFGTGLAPAFAARSFELTLRSAPAPVAAPSSARTPTAPVTTAVQLRFRRAPDTLSPQLANHVGGAERIAAAVVELSGRGSSAGMLLRLWDVQVVSIHVVTNDDDIALVQQRLSLEESIAQLSVDLQEAQRQLTVTESLDKRKMSSSLEVAHAHATTDVLTRRLGVQREHLALVEQQLARWTPLEEEVVLSASRVEMQTR